MHIPLEQGYSSKKHIQILDLRTKGQKVKQWKPLNLKTLEQDRK